MPALGLKALELEPRRRRGRHVAALSPSPLSGQHALVKFSRPRPEGAPEGLGLEDFAEAC